MFRKMLSQTESYGNNEGILHCPACDGEYLHQGDVEVFDRGEDATAGTHVKVSGEHITINRDLKGNPSGRRQGLRIEFSCEQCGGPITLNIYQHKGNTFIGFEYDELPEVLEA